MPDVYGEMKISGGFPASKALPSEKPAWWEKIL
jgi:hypothetical protein